MTTTTHPDGRALSTRAQGIARAHEAIARFTLMDRYRANLAPAPGLAYVPYKIDELGLYCITGPFAYNYGNPLDGFYAVDDFGQLVRVPLASIHIPC